MTYFKGTINEAESENTSYFAKSGRTSHYGRNVGKLGFPGMVNEQPWPTWDEAKTVEQTVDIAVQVNGRVRGQITVDLTDPVELARAKALGNENILRFVEGKTIVKEIYVPGRI